MNDSEKYFKYNYKSVDLPDGVDVQVDFIKYKKVLIIKDFENTVNGKSITLSHVYSSEEGGGAPYGYGFNLNVCEKYNDDVGVLVEANGDTYYKTGGVVKNYIVYGRATPTLIQNVPEANNLNLYNNITWLYADGIFKGYHVSNVKLAIICDTTGNCIFFNYNADGSLQNIKYSKNGRSKLIYELTYTNGKLTKAVDKISNSNIIYSYSGIRLSTITKSGLTYSLAFSTDEDYNQLEEIKTSNGYNIYNFPLSVVLKSAYDKIPNGNTGGEILARWEFKNVADNTIQITDIDGNKEQIKYTEEGYISEQILEQNGVVVSAQRCEYVKQGYHNTYYASRDSLYKSKIEEYIFATGEYVLTQLNEYDQPTKRTRSNIAVTETSTEKSETTYTYDNNYRLTKEQTKVTNSKGGEADKSYTQLTEYVYSTDGKQITKTSYVTGEETTYGKTVEKQRSYTDSADSSVTVSERQVYNSKAESDVIFTEQKYNADGRQISVYDGIDGRVSYSYNDKGEVGSVINHNKNGTDNRTVNYGYDNQSRVTAVSCSGSNNVITYENGETVGMDDGNGGIELEYDGKRRIIKAKVGGQEMESYDYGEETVNGKAVKTVKLKYANGGTVESAVAKDGSYINGYINEAWKYNVKFNKDGSIQSEEDKVTGEVTSYTYDGTGLLKKAETRKNSNIIRTAEYTYDRYGKITKVTGAHTHNYAYENNAAKRLSNEYINGIYDTYYTYDRLGRVSEKKTNSLAEDGEIVDLKTITYEKSGGVTSNRPLKITYAGDGNSVKTIEYSYDGAGRITEIDTNLSDRYFYTYDSVGRLTREENYSTMRRYEYSYDKCGNLTGIEEYDIYEDENGDEIHYGSKQYTYDSKNRLSGAGYEYDGIGNPKKYRWAELSWNCKQLTAYGSTTFGYDGKGRRISKGDITFTYDSEGNLIKQSNGLEFFYDSEGVAGFVYNNEPYYYKKDAQGNIIEILNKTGGVEAKYAYDAWGNHDVYGSATTIRNLNPYRYRGYYYDTETGLYYLQTRYYDPKVGRFLNMDSIDYADPSSIGGLNLYAYCNNDPINYVDPSGCMPNWLKWVIGGIAFVGAIALTAMTGGALSPLVFTMSAGILVSGLIEGGISAVNGGSFEQGFLDGAADGALWGGIFALAGSIFRVFNIARQGITIGKTGTFQGIAELSNTYQYQGLKSHSFLARHFGRSFADNVGWIQNKFLLNSVKLFKGVIYDTGGALTGAYAKEKLLLKGYKFIYNVWLF